MKVLISVDMEGISGIVHSSQASPGARDYEWARTMMAGDANAAVEGAVAGGATEIVVADAHDGMHNLRLNELHPAASLVSGSGRPLSMIHGVDESFDALFMIGYHATCGVPEGIMNHAYISRGLQRVRLNDRIVGEIGIFAAVAGCFGVPTVLVSGDDACCEEATAWLPGVSTVSVKKGINRFAAQCLSQQTAHNRIREAATQVLQAESFGHVQPLRSESPTRFTVELTGSQCADAAARVPGVQRIDERTVSIENADYLQAFASLRLVFDLAARAVDTDY
jgi:D-amino peptidase